MADELMSQIGYSLVVDITNAIGTVKECYDEGASIWEALLAGGVSMLCSFVGVDGEEFDFFTECLVDMTFGLGADLINKGVQTGVKSYAANNTPVVPTLTPQQPVYTPETQSNNSSQKYVNPYQSPAPERPRWKPTYTGFGFMHVGKTHNGNYLIPSLNLYGKIR